MNRDPFSNDVFGSSFLATTLACIQVTRQQDALNLLYQSIVLVEFAQDKSAEECAKR
jgi:hypothetical protein